MIDVQALGGALVGIAAVLGAIGVIWRQGGFGKLKKRTADFLDDWNGEAPRPGYEGRKSFPVRMAEIEQTVAQLKRNGGSSVADAVHEVARGVEELKRTAVANREAIARLDERHNHTDERITDHRKRNDEAATLLRAELERRAQEMQVALVERNRTLDEKLAEISEDVFRASAARAILTELGHKIDPPGAEGQP